MSTTRRQSVLRFGAGGERRLSMELVDRLAEHNLAAQPGVFRVWPGQSHQCTRCDRISRSSVRDWLAKRNVEEEGRRHPIGNPRPSHGESSGRARRRHLRWRSPIRMARTLAAAAVAAWSSKPSTGSITLKNPSIAATSRPAARAARGRSSTDRGGTPARSVSRCTSSQ